MILNDWTRWKSASNNG